MDLADLLMSMMQGNNNDNDLQYEEIRKLDHLLIEADIPHEFHSHMSGGYQITYYGKKGKPEPKPGVIQGAGVGAICSAIETPFSYGVKEDKIEISGLLTDEEAKNDSVVGFLTAKDVFERIKAHWNNSCD